MFFLCLFKAQYVHYEGNNLDRARSGTLLALLSARQRRDDVPRRVARSAIDAEELLVKGRELEVRLRPLELRQRVHV